jgi:5-dehydro-2-deoxygluconokinase
MAGEIDDATLISRVQGTFVLLIESWREARA